MFKKIIFLLVILALTVSYSAVAAEKVKIFTADGATISQATRKAEDATNEWLKNHDVLIFKRNLVVTSFLTDKSRLYKDTDSVTGYNFYPVNSFVVIISIHYKEKRKSIK